MTRALETVQAERFDRTNIAVITLVKITTYTDREAGTISYTHYLSTRGVDYDYGGTGVSKTFLPLVLNGSPFFTGINHLPKPSDTLSTDQTYTLYIANSTVADVRLAHWLANDNAEGADVEVSQLAIPPATMAATGFVALLGYTGTEHTVLFRGRVKRLTSITEEKFELECVVTVPDISNLWVYANDPTLTDPLDLGKRYPYVYGEAKRIPAINYDVGWVTTLAEDIDSTETGSGYKITDGTGFPTGSFTARIDGEEMTCSTGAATTFTIVSRGSPASAHLAGAVITEIKSSTIIVLNGAPSVGLDALYAINPLNDELMRLDSAASYWPTISYSGYTTATFSAAKLSDLMDAFRSQAIPAGGITVQPEFTNPKTEARFLMTAKKVAVIDSNSKLPYASSHYASYSDYVASGLFRLDQSSTNTDQDGLWFWLPTGLLTDTGRTISQFRFVAVVDVLGDSGSAMDFYFNWDFAGASDHSYVRTTAGTSLVEGTTFVSDYDIPSSATVADLENTTPPAASDLGETLCVYLSPSTTPNGDGYVIVRSIEMVVEFNDEDLTRNTDAEASSGGSTGFGLRFFSDLRGIEVPSVSTAYEIAHDFESGSWVDSNCSSALSTTQKNTGTYSLALTWDADAEAVSEPFDTDVITGWDGIYCAAALDAGEGHRASSSYALEGTAENATNNALLYWDTFGATIVEGFESGTWNALNASAAISATNPKTGTNSLAITHDVDAEHDGIAFSTDSLTGWTDSGPTTLSVETGLGHTEGSGCIKANADGGTAVHVVRSPTFSAKDMRTNASDGTGQVGFAVDIYVDFNGDPTPAEIEFIFKDSGGIDGFDVVWSPESFTDQSWHTVICSYDARWREDSGVDPTDITQVVIIFARVVVADMFIAIDNARWIRTNCVVQNNAIGGVDMTATDDAYSLAYYCGGDNRQDVYNAFGQSEGILDADLYLATATWSGTTLGTDSWYYPIDPLDVRGSWQTLNADATPIESGTFDKTDVNSMRIVVRNQEGVYARDPVIVHYFDDLGVFAPLTPPSADFAGTTFRGEGRGLLMFDFKIKKGGSTGTIQFRWGTDPDNYWHTGATYSTDDFTEDTWVTVILAFYQTASEVGEVTWTDINYFAVEFNQATRSATAQVYLDNVKLVYDQALAQDNAIGGVDMSSYADRYYVSYYTDGEHAQAAHITILITDSTWTGTAYTYPFGQLQFNPPDVSDAWTRSFATLGNFDDADITNIASMRVIARNSPGIYSRDPVVVHYIDTLEKNAPETKYQADPFAVMVHPSDVIQHWITVVGGERLEPGSAAKLVAALGVDAAWAFDARGLGFGFVEILQRMAFEARCNITPINTPTGREWRLLSADNTYGFGESVATLTQTHTMRDDGHDLADLASHFTFRYAYDASLPSGGSESGYKGILLATSSVSDVPIAVAKIAAARARFGNIAADPIAFRCIQDDATAQDVAGYYVQERIMTFRHGVYTLEGVAWFEAMAREVGDIVSIQPPWEPSALRCRITSMEKNFADHTWTITAVTVRFSGEHA